ncbi:hypothetical protein [Asticcacaulis taihuensis]|uniref:hypothetical protein n=1 Tax=Asticcacaulis taihuensis TaxID=260084 RepID=UPI003F7BB579
MPPLGQFSKLEMTHSLEFLKAFHGMLEFEDVTTREQMFDVLTASFKNRYLDAAKFAGDLGFSPSSVYRWLDGRGLPHRAVWPLVVTWIRRELEGVIANYKAAMKSQEAVSVDE